MPLRDRLLAERAAQFVGRDAEHALFRERLGADVPGVLHVHGPGGVGKTTLLRSFERAAGVPTAWLDLHDVTPSPASVAAAFASAEPAFATRYAVVEPAFADAPVVLAGPAFGDSLGGDSLGDGAALPAAGLAGVRRVLFVDTLEAVADLDAWLREDLLPRTPDDLLVVLAGRCPLGAAWRADPGWQALLREIPLGHLSPDEARALLQTRGVDPTAHAAALDFARGHPLALALVAEAARRETTPWTPEPGDADTSPDLVRALLDRFLSHAAGDGLRAAVEAGALVRRITEDMLAALLDAPVSTTLFAELAALPIAAPADGGLVLHDLARDVIAADLRWRAPDRYARYHARARSVLAARVRDAATSDLQRAALSDYAFLYRDSPVVGPLLSEIQRALQPSDLHLDAYSASDRDAVLAMVERHEGAANAAHVGRWLGLQPEHTLVARQNGRVAGVLVRVRLDLASPAERDADPVARAAWHSLHASAPRGGEAVLLFRTWMDADAHQGPSPVQALLFAQTVWDYLRTPDLAVSLLACARPHIWTPVMAFADLSVWTDAEAGGVGYDLFGHEWRAQPPDAWLARLSGQAVDAAPAEVPPAAAAPTVVVLDQPSFAGAVRDALRGLTAPGGLAASPLLGTRFVVSETGPGAPDAERTAVLDRCLRAAIDGVAEVRRGERYAAALRVSFVRPAPSQEIAAERLGVPYSTFRRHLARGIDLVVDTLWQADGGTT